MAGGKLNARQKMINLMYLVFIAMMALNIDREVLSSFWNIDQSLVNTNNLSKDNNNDFMKVIAKRAQDDPEYKETQTRAEDVRKNFQDLIGFIEGLKGELMPKEGEDPIMGEDGELNYAALSNLENVTSLFFVSDKEPTETGNELVANINKYNEYLDKLAASSNNDSIKGSIDYTKFKIKTENEATKGSEKRQSWLHKTFYGQPQIAAVTTLTKYQNDVYNAETQIIRSFLTTKMLDDIEINTFKGVISSPGILTVGSSAQTFVALGAFDNGISGTATVNGKSYPVVDGKATVPIPTGSTGDFSLKGTMSFKNPSSGQMETIPLEPVNYSVVDQTITDTEFTGVITADKMNVFYVGLQNPVSATVSGVEPNTITVSGPGYRSTGRGKGIVTPSSVGTINLTVSGTTSEGKKVSKSLPFRVKPLPRPEAMTRGKTMMQLPASSIAKQSVSARMPSDFAFDLSVNVTGFGVKVTGKASEKVSGNSLRNCSSCQNLKRGQTVTIFDVKTSSSAPVGNATNNVVIEVL